MPPFIAFQNRQKVDGKAPADALFGKRPRGLQTILLNLEAVVLVGREGAAEEHLPAVAAEYLIVGRDRLQLPERVDAELRRRGALDLSFDELLHNSAHDGELLLEQLPGHILGLEGELRKAAAQPAPQ